MKTHQSNTYDLIMESESEDRSRSLIETIIYALLILSAVVSICQFAAKPIVVPGQVTAKVNSADCEQVC